LPGSLAADPLAPLLRLPGVLQQATAAREAIDRLLSHRILRRQSAPVSAESALRGARASAALEGAELGLETLRAGAAEDPTALAALRISAGLGASVSTWERAPLQVLARLHVLAAAGRVPPDRLGRPSGDPEVSARLDGLAHLVAGGTRVQAVIEAAVVHGELLAVRPFGSFDGLIARAASRLTLITRGLDPKAVSVPDVGHLELASEYRSALAGYATGEPDNVARWLRHCSLAVELGAREGLAICEAVLRG
jgi:hypothetical protein